MKVRNPLTLFTADVMDAVADMIEETWARDVTLLMGGLSIRVGKDPKENAAALRKAAKEARDNCPLVEELFHDRIPKKCE